MKKVGYILLFFAYTFCTNKGSTEKDILGNINKEINLSMITTVNYKTENIRFDIFRNKYEYWYLVYLKQNCLPCYPKYVEWQNKMNSINKFDFVTVLFIIKGKSYDEFINGAIIEGLEEDRYYTLLDPKDSFIKGNENIPEWIIDTGIRINGQNEIIMIGSPFSTPEMTKVFYDLCSK